MGLEHHYPTIITLVHKEKILIWEKILMNGESEVGFCKRHLIK